MRLYRSDCTTDWKGRPSHSLKFIGESDSIESLIEAQNADVRRWMAQEVAADEAARKEEEEGWEMPDGWDVVRAAQLESDPGLVYKWETVTADGDDNNRFEMFSDGAMRSFVCIDDDTGDRSTTAYHILDNGIDVSDQIKQPVKRKKPKGVRK